MLTSRRSLLRYGSLVPLLLASKGASAQKFPDRVVRIVVPFTPGGSADLSARILGDKLATMWGQPVILENKPGAGTMIASAFVARAEPTGHYIYLAYNMSFAATANLTKKLTYDPINDLAPISTVADAPFVIAVGPSLKVNTLSEFLAAAKQRTLTFASTGIGAGPHLATEIFLRAAGLKCTHVPYRGSADAITGLLGGFVDFSFFDVSALGTLTGGAATPLAVTSKTRWNKLPNVPTVAEAASLDYEMTSGSCILVPKDVPEEVRTFLNRSVVEALRSPDVIARFAEQGFTAAGSTADELSTKLKSDIARVGQIIRELGLDAG